jgi:hypothetical protein
MTLGIFVLYPACASVQRQASTSVEGYGSVGETEDSSFDCDGVKTDSITHDQLSAGGEVVRETAGALAGGAHVEVLEDIENARTERGHRTRLHTLANGSLFIRGDYLWFGHELGLGLTFSFEGGTPIPSPWYRLRLGREDNIFLELMAGSRRGFLQNANLLGGGLGVRFRDGTLRIGASWGGRAVVSSSRDEHLRLAINYYEGDIVGYAELRFRNSKGVELYGAVEAGTQAPTLTFGVRVPLDDGSRQRQPVEAPAPNLPAR